MGKNDWLRNEIDITWQKFHNINDLYETLNLGEKLQKIFDINEKLFERLDRVQVVMNNDNN